MDLILVVRAAVVKGNYDEPLRSCVQDMYAAMRRDVRVDPRADMRTGMRIETSAVICADIGIGMGVGITNTP